MRCTEILGNINDPSFEILLRRRLGGAFAVDEVVLDATARQTGTVNVTSEAGREIAIDLATVAAPDGVGRRGGLLDGDVLATFPREGMRPARVVTVRLRTAEVLRISVAKGDPAALARACWEVGNMHAPLFKCAGLARADADGDIVLLTPSHDVLERMLRSIPGVRIETVKAELDPNCRFTSAAADAVVGLASDFTIVRHKKKGQ